MNLKRLDHVTVNCADLASSRAFYGRALGMREGDRPAFDFPGAWFYLDDRPVVHLVGAAAGPRGPTGAFDHLAFEALAIDEVRARFREEGLGFEESVVPGAQLRQLFVHDPDGVKIELNFRD